jgi:N6-adenosine-specific RNA methylase IME4
MSDEQCPQVVYADPPWEYDWPGTRSQRGKDYPTLPVNEIIPLRPETAENAVIYLWATAPKLPEALVLMEAWGFKYKTCAVWDKELVGMGYWFRNQHELLLVGVKGAFPPPPEPLRVPSVFRSRRREHSRKPDYIRVLIEKWYPGVKKLEMFARERWPGWEYFGNEIPATVQEVFK